MIVVRIKGGLGNQMFEYAMARKLQIDLKLDKIGFDLTVVDNDLRRSFSLYHFSLFNNIEIIEQKSRITLLQETIAKKIVSYFIAGRQEAIAGRREDFWGMIFGFFGIVQRDHSLIKKNFWLKFHRNIYMNGWFQDADRLLPIRDILLKDFQLCSPGLSDCEIYKKIISTNAVCVHIRKGDYVGNSIFDVCGDIYYYDAINYVAQMVQNPVFYIFSDDIAEVKRTMNFDYPVVYVSGDHQDYEDLYLMKSCRHFIMSNSTYSWWAQFLGEAGDKVVVAPKKWCLMEDMNIGVYMKEWVLMDVR